MSFWNVFYVAGVVGCTIRRRHFCVYEKVYTYHVNPYRFRQSNNFCDNYKY